MQFCSLHNNSIKQEGRLNPGYDLSSQVTFSALLSPQFYENLGIPLSWAILCLQDIFSSRYPFLRHTRRRTEQLVTQQWPTCRCKEQSAKLSSNHFQITSKEYFQVTPPFVLCPNFLHQFHFLTFHSYFLLLVKIPGRVCSRFCLYSYNINFPVFSRSLGRTSKSLLKNFDEYFSVCLQLQRKKET